jgi:hypothetical protein
MMASNTDTNMYTRYINPNTGETVLAASMSRHEFNRISYYTGDDQPDCDGYVIYGDSQTWWYEKGLFDMSHVKGSDMSFGMAIEAMKKGMRVARSGWNGKGMWLALVDGGHWGIGGHAPYDTPGAAHVTHSSFIGMKTTDNKFVPWLASQTDMLADDWTIVE